MKETKRKFWSLEKKMTVLAVSSIIFFSIFFLVYTIYFPTEGTHTGIITATEKNTFIFTTKMVYFKTNPMSTQEDQYCVVSKEVFDMLAYYQQTQQRVTIHFKNGWVVPAWDCGGGISIIVKVEPT